MPARWLKAGRQRVQVREQHLELMLLRWDVFQFNPFPSPGAGMCFGETRWDLFCSPRHPQ